MFSPTNRERSSCGPFRPTGWGLPSNSRTTVKSCAGKASPLPTESGSRTTTRTSVCISTTWRGKADRLIDENPIGGFWDLAWSSDSLWLAYVTPADNAFGADLAVRRGLGAEARLSRATASTPTPPSGVPTASGSTCSPTVTWSRSWGARGATTNPSPTWTRRRGSTRSRSGRTALSLRASRRAVRGGRRERRIGRG